MPYMSIKQLDVKFKNKLEYFAKSIQANKGLNNDKIIKVENIKVVQSYTYGWSTEILKIKKPMTGSIILWIDMFPNVGRPILSFSYYSYNFENIKNASVLVKNISSKELITTKNIQIERGSRFVLKNSFKKDDFNTFITEKYYGEKYFTYYSSGNAISNKTFSKLLDEIVLLSNAIIAEVSKIDDPNIDYKKIENRQLVTFHKKRERSKYLSRKAKVRDGFVCKICDFKFADFYGSIGYQFAEAHHIIALSKLKGPISRSAEDLITVCSNCHRMLHRMDGKENDVEKLRKMVMKLKRQKTKNVKL